MNKDKWIIGVDLDGTLLTKENKTHPINTKVLNELEKQGHIICIVTGRPWRGTKEIYDDLGFGGIVANHNGAHIHNPEDDAFVEYKISLNRKLLKKVIETKLVQNYTKNIVVETQNSIYAQKNDQWLNDFFHLTNEIECEIKDILNHELDLSDLSVNPFGVLVHLTTGMDDNQTLRYIAEARNKFESAFIFRYWNAPENKLIIEINSKLVNKQKAMEFLCAHYNIPLNNTICFGDGLNDIEMIRGAGHGVALDNANNVLKSVSNAITKYTNEEGGVGHYLNHFFNLGFEF